MTENAASNLDEGSKACPVLSECRDLGQGIAERDFRKVVYNGGLLGFYAAQFAGAAEDSEPKRGVTSVILAEIAALSTANYAFKNSR